MVKTTQSILILCGLPASGKSTYAREWVAADPDARSRINYDDLRLEMFGPDWVYNRADEAKMKTEALAQANLRLLQGASLVIDNTNLTTGARAPWIKLAKDFGVPHEIYEIPTPIEECVRRDKLREGRQRVGRAVIERFALFNGFVDWEDIPGKFVVVDVDGTLANLTHRRKFVERVCLKCGRPKQGDTKICQRPVKDGEPIMCCGEFSKKDWDGFFAGVSSDTPIQPIFSLVRTLSREFTILVVSGRGLECGKATEDWLDRHWPNVGSLPTYKFLFMRRDGDRRVDWEVKQDILDLLPKDRIAYVLDDRPQVLRMWQAAGLTTLAVGDLKEF